MGNRKFNPEHVAILTADGYRITEIESSGEMTEDQINNVWIQHYVDMGVLRLDKIRNYVATFSTVPKIEKLSVAIPMLYHD